MKKTITDQEISDAYAKLKAQRINESERTTGRLALDLTTAHATATTARDAADTVGKTLEAAKESHQRDVEDLRAKLESSGVARRDAEIRAARLEGEIAAIKNPKA